MEKKYYEFREGNGNEGNYFRGVFMAKDLEQANNIVRRQWMNLKSYYRRQLFIDWETDYIYYTLLSKHEDDYSRYTAQLREISKEDYEHGLNRHWQFIVPIWKKF